MSKIDRNKPLPTEGLVHIEGAGLTAGFVAALELERERQELTKSAVAERLGVAPARFTEWTAGKHIPSVAVIEQWIHALGLRVQLVPVKTPAIDPATLTDDQLVEFCWALKHKSRRVAKAVLSATLADSHATSADVDAVAQYLAKHERREAIEKLAAARQ